MSTLINFAISFFNRIKYEFENCIYLKQINPNPLSQIIDYKFFSNLNI